MFSIDELEEMKDFSVLDFVYKIDEIMNKLEPRAEKSMALNIEASRDSRKYFRQIKFICDVARSKIQINLGKERKVDLIEEELKKETVKRENIIKRHKTQKENAKKARYGKKK